MICAIIFFHDIHVLCFLVKDGIYTSRIYCDNDFHRDIGFIRIISYTENTNKMC